jgi:hypothetical protein
MTYQIHLNEDNTKCIVNETYANSDADLDHLNELASKTIPPKIFEVAKIVRFDAYGNFSEKLQKAL